MRAWEPEEDQTIIELLDKFGPKWSKIVQQLPGRSVSSVRNRWQRIEKGRKLRMAGQESKNRCQQCGEPKRGHVCMARLKNRGLNGQSAEEAALAWREANSHQGGDTPSALSRMSSYSALMMPRVATPSVDEDHSEAGTPQLRATAGSPRSTGELGFESLLLAASRERTESGLVPGGSLLEVSCGSSADSQEDTVPAPDSLRSNESFHHDGMGMHQATVLQDDEYQDEAVLLYDDVGAGDGGEVADDAGGEATALLAGVGEAKVFAPAQHAVRIATLEGVGKREGSDAMPSDAPSKLDNVKAASLRLECASGLSGLSGLAWTQFGQAKGTSDEGERERPAGVEPPLVGRCKVERGESFSCSSTSEASSCSAEL